MKNEIERTTTKTITPLKGRQELFCRHITNMAADTFDNATKSYIAAKYAPKAASSGASALLRNSNVKRRIRELHAQNLDEMGISPESVINNIRFDRNKAREAGQWAVAATLDKLEGSVLAMFSDSHVLRSGVKQPELSNTEQAALKRLAGDYKQLLANPTGQTARLLVEAEVVEETGQTDE